MITRDEMRLREAIERLEDEQRPKRYDLSSESNRPSESWDLNTPFAEARELARVGWQEKAAELWRQIGALAPKVETGFAFRWDVAGDAVDVARFLSGEPECMMTHTIAPQSAVQVLVNISAVCSADARLLFNRGIAIAAVIHALQSSGRGVSLDITEKVIARGSAHETSIEVQRFGDYINPAQLAFWVAHPAALRRCVFRYNEQQPDEVRDKLGFYEGGGYGRPVDLDTTKLPEGVVYIPHPEEDELHHYRNSQQALRHIVEMFQRAGTPISLDVHDI